MIGLREAIARLLEDPLDLILARTILGSVDAAEIASLVEAHVERVLGRQIVSCEYFTQSVGAVFVVTLDNRERVAIKAHAIADTDAWRGFRSVAEIEAVYDAQAELADRGFPCARVIAAPSPFARGAAAIMSVLPDVKVPDPHAASVRQAMAELLARSVELGRSLGARDRLPRSELPATLFQPPHNALFDLSKPGGEAIDERARRARAVLDGGDRFVVMHTDFSCANVRVHDGRVTAVFDMDSMCWIDEMRCLASAAVHYTYAADPPWKWPTDEEAQAFADAYATARGRPFDATERARFAAAAEYARAYTARCEHGIRGA